VGGTESFGFELQILKILAQGRHKIGQGRIALALETRQQPIALTSNKRAAARADMPRSSARQNRSRKSIEQALVHAGLRISGQFESQIEPLENP
jgi:hypothetical protein